ncbi:MAG: hypothetical protein HQL90_01800 [Magnetococcales bacterium]|nr:hypothetical protein [Magnetococcales bacterium]
MSQPGEQKSLGGLLKLLAPLLVAIPAVAILSWTFYFTSNQLEQWAESSLDKIGEQVIEKTENFLNSAAFSADYNATWIAANANTEKFTEHFYQMAQKQMAHFPHYKLIYFGDQSGNHWLNKRDPDGKLRARVVQRLDDSAASRELLTRASALSETDPAERESRRRLLAPLLRTAWHEQDGTGRLQFSYWDPLKAYDPRLRPWYRGAEAMKGKSWIDVYSWENKFQDKVEYEAGITVSYPVVQQGRVLGVVGIDLVLGAISEFLSELQVAAHGRAFIFDSQGRVVGMPHQSQLLRPSRTEANGVARLRLHDLQDVAVATSYETLRNQLGVTQKNGQSAGPLGQFSAQVIRFFVQGEAFLGFFRPLDPDFQLDWYVGVLMPESDVKGALEEQFRWVFIGIFVVVLLFFALIPLHLKAEKDRRWIQNAFSKYVSPNRVAYLLKNPDHLALGGEYRDCSFVMTDLAGFTAMMEQCTVEPQEIVHTLNEYLDGMVGIAFKHEGTLDRIVGDAVAVLFSAPVVQEDHAQRAVNCALEMDRFATQFALEKQRQGLPFGFTRIGVNSGRVLLGNFGGKLVFDYRALGDPINTASRLESINNQLGTRVCVSGETVSRVSGFCGRLVGHLILKGKENGIHAYQPLPEEARDTPLVRCYESAYQLMASKDSHAFAAFAQALAKWPEDPLLRFHYARLLAGQSGESIFFTDK